MTNATADEPRSTSPSDDRPRSTAAVKKPESHGSHRITPPKPIRDYVGMEADEPWSWFYHTDSGRIFLRRSGATLEGIPNDVRMTGTAEARQNGKYLDFAIPPNAVAEIDMNKGDRWEFRPLDIDTIAMIPEKTG